MNLTTESRLLVEVVTNQEKSKFIYDDKIFDPLPLISNDILFMIVITSIIVIIAIVTCLK